MMIRLFWLSVLSAFLLAAGCSSPQTPIDENSLPSEQQKIVEEARRFLGESRLEFQSPPQVIRIKKMSQRLALRTIEGDDSRLFGGKDGENDAVWLVVFEGEMRIIPPDPNHTFTPGPFSRQCVYVIVNPVTHMNALRNGQCPR